MISIMSASSEEYEDFSFYFLSLLSLSRIFSLFIDFFLSRSLMDQWRILIHRQVLILVNPKRGPRSVLLGSIIDNFFICDFYIDQGHEETRLSA